MLKKYLSSYYSNEQLRIKKQTTRPRLDFQGFTKAKFINQDSTQRTIDYSSPKIQQNDQKVKIKQSNLSVYAQQMLSRRKLHNESNENDPQLDLMVTKRDDKYRSVSQTHRNQLLKRQGSEEKCKSSERIKVIDVFNSSPRNNKQSYQTYLATKDIVKLKESIIEPITQKQSKISIHINQPQQQQIKNPISSRLNDSREILQLMRRKSTNNQNKKYFFSSPHKEEIKQIQQIESQQNIKRNLRQEIEKAGENENILELLLLSTQELNRKFRKQSEEKLKIRVRAGSKFPKDFF